MASLQKFTIPNFQNGIVRENAVDFTLVPTNTVQFAQNLHFDQIGAVKLRPGVTLLGSQIDSGETVLGMANYRDNAGTTFRLLSKVKANVYSFNGTNHTSVRASLNTSSKARFTNFIDLTYMVNGNNNEILQTFDGSAFGSSNVADLPKGDFIETYRSRVWVADNATDKVFYSDVVNTDNTLTGGLSFIQIAPQDGEKIRGLKKHPRALLVFKENHIYRIFSINSSDPDPSINRGTYSQESIVDGKNGISYHHPTGFYDFVFDGQQREISRPIIDIIEAIPRSSYEDIVGWTDDGGDGTLSGSGDHKYWSIGDITLQGVTFNNVVCRYTISTQVWTVYTYATQIRSATLYDDGNNLRQAVGDDDGNALTFNSGTSDNGTDIFYDLQTHWLSITQIKATSKTIAEIAALHENAQGATLQYQVDTDSPNKWRKIGTIRKDLYDIQSLNAVSFSRIRFRLVGATTGSPILFRTFEILSSLTDGDIKRN